KSNTNAGNLGWQDEQKLGTSNDDVEYDEMTGFYNFLGGEFDEFNNWNIHGLPDAYVVGALYANKWNSDQQSLNSSYKYNRLGTYNVDNLFMKNILPESTQLTNQTTTSNSLLQRHGITLRYDWK